MRGAAKCVIDVTVCHWCHPVMIPLSLMPLWITDVTNASVSLMSLCHCGSLMSLCHWCHWCHCASLVSLCVTDVTMSLMLLCHWCHCITDVTMSAAPYKSLFCSYHILMSSVIYLSDEGLTLETSALKLFIFMLSTQLMILNYPIILSHWHSTTVSLETYPLYYWTVAQLHAIDLLRVTWKWNNFFPLSNDPHSSFTFLLPMQFCKWKQGLCGWKACTWRCY